jgi:hypothetical protein
VSAMLTPGMASGPKWPWPGMSSWYWLEKGLNLRCGPTKQRPLFIEPASRWVGQLVGGTWCAVVWRGVAAYPGK